MRKNGTLSYLLSDHLGSTSITTNSSGVLVSELRYKPWGETRYSSGTTPTNYKYTGQREESSFGLYFYNARWYDSSLGRFAQADSIVPGGVQGLDRYAYVNNSPIQYTDPSGHMADDGDDGGIACYPGELACQFAIDDYEQTPPEFESPTSGWHTGTSTTIDAFIGQYYYEQTDHLFNWKTGTFYTTTTTGTGTYVGGINGASVEKYFGLTFVHGIPLSADSEKIAGLLTGPNFDFSGDAGTDLLPEIEWSAGQGLSIDQNPNTGGPAFTTAGPMYANELKVGVGVSVLPSPIDVGFQGGNSVTIVQEYHQISWWPFR